MKILAVILLIAISASYTHADPAPRIAVNTHHDGTVWPAGIPYVDHGYARPPVRARPVVEEIIEPYPYYDPRLYAPRWEFNSTKLEFNPDPDVGKPGIKKEKWVDPKPKPKQPKPVVKPAEDTHKPDTSGKESIPAGDWIGEF